MNARLTWLSPFSFFLACLGAHACFFDPSGIPDPAVLQLTFSQTKKFDFSWSAAAEADYYQLLERTEPSKVYVQVGDNVVGESVSLVVPLHLRFDASYTLRSCNLSGCVDSEPLAVEDSLVPAIGYFKASNAAAADFFGGGMASAGIALSEDGNTLVVCAASEDGASRGIGGDEGSEGALDSGAVYVFARSGETWLKQAYIKASNTGAGDQFGSSVALSSDGNILAVGTPYEDSAAKGTGAQEVEQNDDSAPSAGAVYVFVRVNDSWSQQAYIKASDTFAGDSFGAAIALSADGNTLAVGADGVNGPGGQQAVGATYVFVRASDSSWVQQDLIEASNPDPFDGFGDSVSLSDDGNILAVGAWGESSAATGVDNAAVGQDDNSEERAGAVYVFTRASGKWIQESYIKASNTETEDHFGRSVVLAGDGRTLAVGAHHEQGSATGIDGDEGNGSFDAGAVYVFGRNGGTWQQRAYVKASNTAPKSYFGRSVALSDDGNILAVGATLEDGGAAGLDGDPTVLTAPSSGAVYLFVRAEDQWSQRAYIKAPNPQAEDYFGYAVALSGDGTVLAVAAPQEDSAATQIGGDQTNNSADGAGAVYLY